MGASKSTGVVRDRDVVPRPIRFLLIALLGVGGLISAPFLGRGGPLPMTTLLDVWILLLAVWMFCATRIRTSGVLLLIFAYAITRIFPAVVDGSPLEDFLQAYRWVWYLAVVALAVGKKWPRIVSLVNVTWFLIGLAILKGIATRVLLGATVRPGLLLENNFEIPLFAGLVAVLYRHLGRYRVFSVLAVGLLTVVSGSRSGIIAFVILAVYAVTQNKRANLFVRYLAYMSIPAAGGAAYFLFAERFESEGQIDRLNFFAVFLREVDDWSPLQWIFGTTPITPLSSSACNRLSYFVNLFSSEGDGSCYSVILHSFLMRVVFDAGIVGLVLSFGLLWYLMRRAQVQTALTLTLIAVAVANSASVSGPNNPYVLLPIVFAILLSHLPQAPWLTELTADEQRRDRRRLATQRPLTPTP
ncbi:hypothetical protein [Microbacterium trichothecenolyticum]|uniref:O-antigen ligase-like membrane protein n=1 Tax=Microbacterium trichothecenolyticum TaxID=69370 RepID=A0ABU0TP52_MICTR|nr:hypothetical protein [Microbacterium trichothecenolyticum]MDQ1121452.1 hypothetical protein [Microbacterium trichothecenolyticum]